MSSILAKIRAARGNDGTQEVFIHPAVLEGSSKKRLNIYLPIFLSFFAITLSVTPFTNHILYLSCLYKYQYPKEECTYFLGKSSTTNNTSEIVDIVQSYSTYLLTINTMITNIVPALLSLVLGPWSDKYGRRPILLLTIFGYAISFISVSVLALISESYSFNPWLLLLTNIPVALTGGSCVLITMVFAYITDCHSSTKRARSMIYAQALIGIAQGIGQIGGGVIYDHTNLFVTYLISAICLIIGFFWILFINIESLHVRQGGSKVRALFSMEVVQKFWETSTKTRKPYYRTFIWCVIVTVVLQNFVIAGELNIFYLFTSKKFEWSVSEYNNFKAITSMVMFLACVLCSIIVITVLKISMMTLIFVIMMGNISGSIIKGFAAYGWQIYAGQFIASLQEFSVPLLRSILSVLVVDDEVATIFSINNSLQYLVAIGAAPIYSFVYSNTLSFNPGLFNFLSVCIYSICVLLVGTMVILRKYLGLTATGTLKNTSNT